MSSIHKFYENILSILSRSENKHILQHKIKGYDLDSCTTAIFFSEFVRLVCANTIMTNKFQNLCLNAINNRESLKIKFLYLQDLDAYHQQS